MQSRFQSPLALGALLTAFLLPVDAAADRAQARQERARIEARYVEERVKADAKAVEVNPRRRARS